MRHSFPARKDFIVSNSSSSPVVLRIQQSAVVFVVMLLALGALVLAANNIDPNASIRGDIRYSLWKSPDGLLSMEYPAGWSIQGTNSPLQYAIAPQDGSAQGAIALVPVSAFGLKVTDADKNPQNVMNQIIAQQAGSNSVTSRPVFVDGIRGVAATMEVSQTDQTSGATQTQDNDFWELPLDGSHLLVATISTSNTNWVTIKPLWEHMMNSLRVDRAAALRALGVGVPTATPTAAPTQAATEQSTESATSAATAVATTAP